MNRISLTNVNRKLFVWCVWINLDLCKSGWSRVRRYTELSGIFIDREIGTLDNFVRKRFPKPIRLTGSTVADKIGRETFWI
jgi:hypothetical protein